MKFCTIFRTEERLKALLQELYQEFKTTLHQLKAKEEWGVKVYSDHRILKEQIGRSNREIRDLDREIRSSPKGKAYLLRKRREELLTAELGRKMIQYSQESFKRLEQFSLESRISKLLPKEVTEKKADMILNAAYLVEKGRVRSFLSEVQDLKKEYNSGGIAFECTGPWPPYHFCSHTVNINAR
jgi:hypothetical protein